MDEFAKAKAKCIKCNGGIDYYLVNGGYNCHTLCCPHCKSISYMNEMQIEKKYKVFYTPNHMPARLYVDYIDIVKCIKITPKSYLVQGETKTWLIKKDNIMGIKEIN